MAALCYVTDIIAISWIKVLFLESILSNFVFLLALRTHQLSFGPPHLHPQYRAARGGWTGRFERTTFDFFVPFSLVCFGPVLILFLSDSVIEWKHFARLSRGWRGTFSVPVAPCPVPQTIFSEHPLSHASSNEGDRQFSQGGWTAGSIRPTGQE